MSGRNPHGRHRHGLRTYLARRARAGIDRLLFRLDRERLRAVLRALGLPRGAIVCVHASLSKLGYIDGGADAVIDALQDVVGPDGTVMMPSFPSTDSALAYIRSGERFDTRHTPSRSGAITEAFRTRPQVLRSEHPTNPVVAMGGAAADLVARHDASLEPYGHDTPFGRLAQRDDAYILMLDVHIHSFLHHLQARVGLPTLYLPDTELVEFIDRSGARRSMRTRVMRPRHSYFIAVPGRTGSAPDWAILHDFGLIFPARREARVRRLGYRFEGYPRLWNRRALLEEDGVLRTTRVGRGEAGLLRVQEYVRHIEPELRELIDRFRPYYDPAYIEGLGLHYG